MGLTAGQQAFSTALQHDLPGLLPVVADAWTSAEVGAYNNLGITYYSGGKQYAQQFATPQAGAAAAAAQLRALPGYYAPLLASLKSTNPNTQATAIAKSPWNGHGAGNPTYSPYYSRIFGTFGLTVPGNAVTSSSVAAKTATAPARAAQPAPAAANPGTVASLGLGGLPASTPLTATMVGFIVDAETKLGVNATTVAADKAYYTAKIGQPVNGIPLTAGTTGAFNNPLGGVTPGLILNGTLAGPIASGAAAAPAALSILGLGIGKVLLVIGGGLCIIVGIWIVIRHEPQGTDPALIRALAASPKLAAVA